MDIEKILAFNKENVDIHAKGWEELPGVMEDYWDRLSTYIASDISGAIDFLCNSKECTAEIFLDWSEVFDDVVRKSNSREFADSLMKAYERFAAECEDYDIPGIIDYAKGELRS